MSKSSVLIYSGDPTTVGCDEWIFTSSSVNNFGFVHKFVDITGRSSWTVQLGLAMLKTILRET